MLRKSQGGDMTYYVVDGVVYTSRAEAVAAKAAA